MPWYGWIGSTLVQSAWEAVRITPLRFQLSLSLVHDRFQNTSSPDCALSEVPSCVDGMRMYGMSTLGPEEMDELDAADRILGANMKRQGRALFDAASEPAHSVRVAMNDDG